MNTKIMGLLAAATAFTAVPAHAVSVVDGSSGLAFDAFATGTRGTLQASNVFSGTAPTFSATVRTAVYLNTLGTLDFYYQFVQTGAGSNTVNGAGVNQMVDGFNSGFFGGFTTDGFSSANEAFGIFTAANNPGGSTTTTGRRNGILQTDFGTNGLMTGETSAIYIFRTNATAFNNVGTIGVIDGSTLNAPGFQPQIPVTTPGVPEPATWGMLLLGFGMIGAGVRSRRRSTKVTFA